MGWVGYSLLGSSIVSNFVSFVAGLRHLDQKQSLYYILSFDSFLTGLACLSLLSASIISQLMKEDFLFDGILCSIIFAANAIATATFPLFNLLTAKIR